MHCYIRVAARSCGSLRYRTKPLSPRTTTSLHAGRRDIEQLYLTEKNVLNVATPNRGSKRCDITKTLT
jgi:hypothetical protein